MFKKTLNVDNFKLESPILDPCQYLFQLQELKTLSSILERQPLQC